MATSVIIMNPHAGNGLKVPELLKLVKQYQYKDNESVVITLDQTKDIKKIVAHEYAGGAQTIIAAGGDGTVSAVVHAILSQKINVKFGVLPLGTFNHFAKDLGMPLMLPQAFQVLKKSKTTFVDVAKANDIFFVNNSSLGLYPDIVREREQQKKKGYFKFFAFILTFILVVKRHPYVRIEFEIKGKKVAKDTPFIFVGNNKYTMTGLEMGTRSKLDEGTLCIYMAKRVERLRLVALGISALFGNLINQEDFNGIGMQRCIITSKKKTLLVSYDGEVENMNVPIRYQIVPKALSVIIP